MASLQLLNRAFLFFILLLFVVCSKKVEIEKKYNNKEKILVKIDDKRVITVKDFIRRAEYTIRPVYCRNNYNIDKKIILNSLIAEKLFSIEAGDSSEVLKNERFQLYFRGRKEQAMRLLLYNDVAFNKVKIDSPFIDKHVNFSRRKYELSYMSLPSEEIAYDVIKELKNKNLTIDDYLLKIKKVKKVPTKKLEWNVGENENVLNAIFTRDLKKKEIVGPVKIDDNFYMIFQIKGWIQQPFYTQKEYNEKFESVAQWYRNNKADILYKEFKKKIMSGKTINFYKETFDKVVKILAPLYLKTDKEKKDIVNKAYWNSEVDSFEFLDAEKKLKKIGKQPFFDINGKVWTVNDFLYEQYIHPLVFRKRKMKNIEFGQQLQLAIMDMITDKYLAEEAYKRGYDKTDVVKNNLQMWKDYYNALYYKYNLLSRCKVEGNFKSNYTSIIEKYLNPIVNDLQKKYSDQIYIDVDDFNKIKLTRTNMQVFQHNVPYKFLVPSFPLITTDYMLDYGKKME